MSTLNFRPPGSRSGTDTPPPQSFSDPNDIGTIRNWAGRALPVGASLEPAAAVVDDLQAADPAAADRLREAIGRFPPVGGEIAGFRLVAILGRGTFGRVYLARQGELADRFVALKVSADLVGESQALARLQHTNIVPIYSVHRASPFQAVCMPFFGVTTLAHLLRRFRGSNTQLPATGRQLVDTLIVMSDETDLPMAGPGTGPGTGPSSLGSVVAGELGEKFHLGHGVNRGGGPLDQLRQVSYPDAVCWIGARLADGLEHAHAHGFLHNDLKPANVLLTDEGQPMLLDFGVSEDLQLRAATPGAPVGGTLPYMAPEHLRSVRDRVPGTDARSDVYALGIILFEMLTGAHPFRTPSEKFEDELPRMIEDRSGPPPLLRPLNPAVSYGLEAIVRKCLDPDPARRYQSAGALRDDLDRQRSDLPLLHARVPSIRERLRKWSRRHPRLSSDLTLGTAAAAALALCGLGLYARGARLERFEAETAYRAFDDDLRTAHYLLGTRAPEPGTVDDGVTKCRVALARYGLPGDDGWDRRPAVAALSAEEQKHLRTRLAETCLLLARGHALKAKPGSGPNGPLGDALRANQLAERLAGDAAPRALWEQRADLYRRLNRPIDANKAAAKAKTIPLATADDHYLSGTEALAAGQHREALDLLRKAVELDPGSYRAHMGLGLAHEAFAQYSDAAACYTTAIALRPDHHGGYYVRGLVALRMRDFSRAKSDLDKVAGLTPDRADVFLGRALAHQGLRDFPAGLKDLDRAAEIGAPPARVAFMRVRMKELAGGKDAAKAELADALKQKPTDELGWIARGLARVNVDPAGAAADFDAAFELNPRSLAALQNKAHALSKQGKNHEAVSALGKVLELYPDYVPARAGRGVLLARLGDRDAALADAKAALDRDGGPANTYQVAGIYALLDRADPTYRAEAIRLLTTALRSGFGHAYLETDRDLDPIRKSPEFVRLVEAIRALTPPAPRR